jgi:phospholipid/cholesterol/gamma-HCH transport system permease protein
MTSSDLDSSSKRNPLVGLVEGVGNSVLSVFQTVGGVATLGVSVIAWTFRPPLRLQNIFTQFDFVGVGSIVLVALTGTFSGMVFATQSWSAFELFGAESLVGPTVALTVTRELAPVFSALMVTMRACSAMCTELGTMRVTEQVDALETMAVNPVQYLLVPRVLAGLLMVPLLTMIFDTAGLFGGFFVAVPLKGLSVGTFVLRTQNLLAPQDIWEGLTKGAVFGFTVTLIACYRGYNARGGAKGVGQATTRAMVDAAVAIFVEDYFMGLLFHA